MAVSSPSIPPSGWWWIVFVPSLSYFLTTRWSSFSNSLLQPQQQQQQQQQHAASAVSVNASLVWLPSDSRRTEEYNACAQVTKVFHVRNCRNSNPEDGSSAFVAAELTDRLEWLHDFSTTVVASVWQHSDELGRGGLLLSSGNRIWRWERGGGPIPIGRSLQLDHAGCRSDRTATCRPSPLASTTPDPPTTRTTNWVGGLAMDFWGSDRSATLSYSMGSLIVAEWGEGRLVRLEENGARTPLALLRAPPCHDHKKKKKTDTTVDLYPHQLLMTPFGDLLVLDSLSSSSSSCIYKVQQALTIPPLESLQESRWAHNHSWLEEEGLLMEEPQLFWTPPGAAVVTGMALTSSWTSLYVAVSTTEESSSAALLYQVSLVEEEEEEEEDENEDGGPVKEEPHDKDGAKPEPDTHTQALPSQGHHLVLNVTQQVPEWTRSGPLVVTKQGYLFWVVEHVHLTIWKVVVSSHETKLLGFVTLPDAITSLSLGGVEDSYLYLTTVRSLWRLPTRRGVAHPVTIPTNLAPTHRRPQQPRNQHTLPR